MKHVIFLLAIVFSKITLSQNETRLFNELISNDTSAVPSLFNRPDSVRNAILVASTFPAGFIRIENVQRSTSTSFKNLILGYNRTKQKELWEIARVPGLLPLLINNQDKPKKELDAVLKNYPERIRNASLHFVKHDYNTLLEMEKIHDRFESQYKEITKDFPEQVKDAFNILLRDPMALSLLSENIKTTIALGDLYSKNPPLIRRLSDSLNLELAKRYGIEYQDWNDEGNKDTVSKKELKHLAAKYANGEDYTDDVYAVPNNNSNPNTVEAIDPYPYWSGYPYWQGANYWYPYPWWIQMGFYWPLANPYMFFGLYGNYYGGWYFNHPFYYGYHPYGPGNFNNRYMGRGNFNQGFNRNVPSGGRGAGGFGGRGGGFGGGRGRR